MRFVVPALLSVLMLSGCVSSEQLAAQDDNKCQSYGAAPGSQDYVQCRMWAETERRKKTEFDRAMVAQSNAAPNGPMAFCKGFQQGYLSGWRQVSSRPVSEVSAPMCPVQPLKQGGQTDYDQGFAMGSERGRAAGA